jgi:predicted MPP superfamily phosphohydrolase
MSRRLAWCTDIHLDSTGDTDHGAMQLCNKIKAADVDGVLLTGDISTGAQIVYHLSVLERELQMPIYFVAGNHDFYHRSVAQGRKQLKEVTEVSSYLRYMSTVPFLTLTPTTALVGHDGWYDCLNGDLNKTTFFMNDWRLIQEFAELIKTHRSKEIPSKAQEFSRDACVHVVGGIKAAIRRHRDIVVITHVPPWADIAKHEGRTQDDEHLPWYTSRMMGDTLLAAANAYPSHNFTVLCGHTHGRYSKQIAKNLIAHVGGAAYGLPEVQPIIVVD